MSRKKWIGLGVALIALVVGASWVRSQRADAPPRAAGVRTATLTRGDLTSWISATGRVISNLDVAIKSKASGRVQSLPFNVSDPVKQGDILVELDPIDEQREVDLAKAEVAAAQARVEQSKQALIIAQTEQVTKRRSVEAQQAAAEQSFQQASATQKRIEELYRNTVVNKDELDRARTEAKSAEAAMESARAATQELSTLDAQVELRNQDVLLAEANLQSARIALDVAQTRLDETRIAAPMDGVITERMVQIGQIISSGISNIAGGTPILTVSDLSQLYVIASVDESDIGRVELGKRAVAAVEAYPGRRFEGTIVRIAAKGLNANSVVTFDVWVQLQGDALEFCKPEMTANVEIVCQDCANVVLAPNEAVQYGEGGYFAEFVNPDGAIEKRAVKPGASDGIFTELKEGGQEGETVVLRGQLRSQWVNAPRAAAEASQPAAADKPKGFMGVMEKFRGKTSN
ncbi:MAG: efflux RND transporter periplasmic adaptor subunit [Candidatus Sumerlaeota bacterium]|nr:efflux RND transporter periplasmic adaptor subunit [Candidatus Sumerlaeota bacterium]